MSAASSDDASRACKKTHWPQADRIFKTSPHAVTGAARCAWLSGAASARSPSQPASSGPKPLLLSAVAAAAPPAMLCSLQGASSGRAQTCSLIKLLAPSATGCRNRVSAACELPTLVPQQ